MAYRDANRMTRGLLNCDLLARSRIRWADVFADLVAFRLRFLSTLPILTDHILQMDRAKADTVSGYASRKAIAHQKSKEFHQYLYSVNL